MANDVDTIQEDRVYTELRAEAATFLPSISELTMRSSSDSTPSGSSMPTPSPHLDRYPIFGSSGRRRNTTQAGLRPEMEPRYSPSGTSADALPESPSIENLSVRLKERSASCASNNADLIALRFEHSPLDQLVKNLRVISASLSQSCTTSSEYDESGRSSIEAYQEPADYFSSRQENEPPTAISVSQVANLRGRVHRTPDHARTKSQLPDQRELPALPIDPSTTPKAVPSTESSISISRSRVYVYTDELRDTPVVITSRTNQQARIHSYPPAAMTASAPGTQQLHRHTYPRNDSHREVSDELRFEDGSRPYRHHEEPRHNETDIQGHENQLLTEQSVWHERFSQGSLEITPPAQGRFEQYMQ